MLVELTHVSFLAEMHERKLNAIKTIYAMSAILLLTTLVEQCHTD